MANFSTDADLTFYQPDILTFGIASFTSPNDYHAQARQDIERDLRIKWFPVYQRNVQEDISVLDSIEMDGTLLTDAQFKRLSVYKVIGHYACPQLTKFNSDNNPDRFQVMMDYYKKAYAGEFEDLLRDGVEYDDDNSGTITNSEREAYHRQRLIR
jgi:hypothetical protein